MGFVSGLLGCVSLCSYWMVSWARCAGVLSCCMEDKRVAVWSSAETARHHCSTVTDFHSGVDKHQFSHIHFDTATKFLNVERMCNWRLSWMNCFLIPTGTWTWFFCEMNGRSTINTYSLVNHMRPIRESSYIFRSCLQRVRRATRLASDSCC